jgi:hypothetical protein
MAYTSPEVEERVMEDIVDRLRVLNFMGPWKEAADEIERLREALRLAGDRVAGLAYKMPPPNVWTPQFILLGLTIAREALKEKE